MMLAASTASIACASDTEGPQSQPETRSIGIGRWSGFCSAKFTEEYAVLDDFGDLEFTAHPDDEFLVSSWPNEFLGDYVTELYYLTPEGAIEFEVKVPVGQSQPFELNCEPAKARRHHAVFRDVDVYASRDHSRKLCELSAGAVLPAKADVHVPFGYGLDTDGKFALLLGSFSSQCGSGEKGYVDEVSVELLGANRVIRPAGILFKAE
jgi:hypothetical protein